MRAVPTNDVFAAVAATLSEATDAVSERTIAEVYQELPSYAGVPFTGLRASTQRNLDIAVRALRANRAPRPDELPEAWITVTERVQQGVPVEDMMRAYRINIGVIEARFVELAQEAEVASNLVLAGSRLLWSVGDAFTTQIALVYQELRIEHALYDAQRKAEFIHALLTGRLERTEVASQSVLFGLDPTTCYFAVRGRSRAAGNVEPTRRQLEQRGSTSCRSGLIGIVGGDLAGVVARAPGDTSDLVLGMGPQAILADVADSFRTAGRVLEAAWRLGRTGVLTLADLSWRLSAVADREVADYLTGRYLTPLHQHGEFGRLLLDTVRAFLANGLSTAATAAELVVHPNTLRHRLHKFGELTGASLTCTNDVVEVTWALELATIDTDAREADQA
ncbi:MAG TPA: helix-turn-helix domain-containing protein [Actinophytocola sp.]|jgi:putative transposase|uniref:PucR family transcriptional regulator n=1 Tax=Actinophytocola sp. TaxID=1872138 RepID=UPI002F92B644